jgi:hypothetical protein
MPKTKRLSPHLEDLEIPPSGPEPAVVVDLIFYALSSILTTPLGHFDGVPLVSGLEGASDGWGETSHWLHGLQARAPIISMANLVLPYNTVESDQDTEIVGDAESCMYTLEELACIDPLELIILQESIREAVEDMTIRQRTVMYLHLLGYSIVEIAKAFDIAHTSASDAYWRAVAHLRTTLL